MGRVGGERGSIYGGAAQPWVLGEGIAPLGFLLGAGRSQGPSSGCVPCVAPVPLRARGIASSPPAPLPTASSFGFYPSSSFLCPSTISLHFKELHKTCNCVSFSPWCLFARPLSCRWVSSLLPRSPFFGGGGAVPLCPPRAGCRGVGESGEDREGSEILYSGELLLSRALQGSYLWGSLVLQGMASVLEILQTLSLCFPRSCRVVRRTCCPLAACLPPARLPPWPLQLRQHCGIRDGAAALPGCAVPHPRGCGAAVPLPPALCCSCTTAVRYGTSTRQFWHQLQLQMLVEMVLTVWFPTENPNRRPE